MRSPSKRSREESKSRDEVAAEPAYTLEPIPEESTLKSLVSKEPLREAEQEYELGQLVLPMSINRFFEEFLSSKANFPFDLFSKEVMQITEIEFNPVHLVKDNKVSYPVFEGKLRGVVPISGVPFCSSSNMEKTFRVERPKS